MPVSWLSRAKFGHALFATLATLALIGGPARGAEFAPATQPVAETGNTPVLWLESDRVHANWVGGNLQRITDEETKSCGSENWRQYTPCRLLPAAIEDPVPDQPEANPARRTNARKLEA